MMVCVGVSTKAGAPWSSSERHGIHQMLSYYQYLHPFYLHRGFADIFLTVVYIHPQSDVDVATQTLAGTANRWSKAGNFRKVHRKSFNHCKLQKLLCDKPRMCHTWDSFAHLEPTNHAHLGARWFKSRLGVRSISPACLCLCVPFRCCCLDWFPSV